MLKTKLQKAKKSIVLLGATVLNMAVVGVTHAQEFISENDNITGGGGDLRETIKGVLTFVLGFLGLLAVIMVIYGGFIYLTAAGDTEKAGKGKTVIMYSVIGLVIIFISFALVNTVMSGLTNGA